MKSLRTYVNENLFEDKGESIKDEKTFRDYAENKFKEVFGDELDEDKMKETIDGILKDHEKEAEEGDWGVLVGVLNKSFAS